MQENRFVPHHPEAMGFLLIFLTMLHLVTLTMLYIATLDKVRRVNVGLN